MNNIVESLYRIQNIILNESVESDILYHATFGCYLDNITTDGLIPNNTQNYSDSKDNCVYLANDLHVAASYCEEAEVDDEIYDSGIYIIYIDTNKLDYSKLVEDENVLDDDSTFEYHGVIKPNCFLKIEEYE